MENALNGAISSEDMWKEGKFQEAISLVAVRALFLERGRDLIENDLTKLHGTAVWCLISGDKDEVRYHIDYAELFRYETNVIYPPVYAGTCQLSPVRSPDDMIGGAFCANIDGLAHYKKFGYKGKLQSAQSFEDDLMNPQWLNISYLQNRGILHDGDFPHLSTKISHIRPEIKRVILGFNVFTDHVSECNLRAPEHSDAFNRTIKLYQRMAAAGVPITAYGGKGGKYGSEQATTEKNPEEITVGMEQSTEVRPAKKSGGISIEEVKKNPVLAKLLIQAAKKMQQIK
jgi:hypothetical protein